MSSYIDIDSEYRDNNLYPNPAQFTITADQVDRWFKHNRITNNLPNLPFKSPYDFVHVVKLKNLVIPYSVAFSTLRRIYVDFHTHQTKTYNLINCINGMNADAKFIAFYDRIQNDSAGNPYAIHYKCNMSQVMRFQNGQPVDFILRDKDDNILSITDTTPTPDPDVQVQATFEITPYVNSGEYDNHSLTPYIV